VNTARRTCPNQMISVIAAFLLLYPDMFLVSISKNSLNVDQQGLIIGIVDLETVNVEASEAGKIIDQLNVYLSSRRDIILIGRQQIAEALQANNIGQPGCTSLDCIVQLGKIVAANKMIAGKISRDNQEYVLQLRLVDISTSRVEHYFYYSVVGIEQILQVSTLDIAGQIVSVVTGGTTSPRPFGRIVQTSRTPIAQRQTALPPPSLPAEPEGSAPTTPTTHKKMSAFAVLVWVCIFGGAIYAGIEAYNTMKGKTTSNPSPIPPTSLEPQYNPRPSGLLPLPHSR
jgi:hypothetical protein